MAQFYKLILCIIFGAFCGCFPSVATYNVPTAQEVLIEDRPAKLFLKSGETIFSPVGVRIQGADVYIAGWKYNFPADSAQYGRWVVEPGDIRRIVYADEHTSVASVFGSVMIVAGVLVAVGALVYVIGYAGGGL